MNDPKQIIAEFNAQIGINVRASGASWPADTLAAALKSQGLVRHTDGHWIMPDGEAGALFSLYAMPFPSSHLTLVMDVPCLSPDRNAFAAMTACARELAAQLGGTLVDDGNQPLSDAALAKIADQVAAFYAHMEKSGLAPGSLLAKRLFGRLPAQQQEGD